MFTFRLNSYQLLQVLLILCVSSEVICGQTLKKCAVPGEYCLNHWDCCSNSCFSYSYRCIRRYNTDRPIDLKPTATLEQILEQNFGTTNTVAAAMQPKTYFFNRIGRDFSDIDAVATKTEGVQQNSEHAGNEATVLKNPINLEEASTVVYGKQLDETSQKRSADLDEIVAEKKDGLNEETTKTYKEISNTTTQTAIRSSTEKAPRCAEIGEKCYRSEDCCAKLCHGFLHQCVT